MPAYMIGRVAVKDVEAFKKYAAAAGLVTEKFGGKYLARGGELAGLENHEDDGKRVVIIEFPDMQTARAWYDSPEYQAAKKLREDAAFASIMIVEGA